MPNSHYSSGFGMDRHGSRGSSAQRHAVDAPGEGHHNSSCFRGGVSRAAAPGSLPSWRPGWGCCCSPGQGHVARRGLRRPRREVVSLMFTVLCSLFGTRLLHGSADGGPPCVVPALHLGAAVPAVARLGPPGVHHGAPSPVAAFAAPHRPDATVGAARTGFLAGSAAQGLPPGCRARVGRTRSAREHHERPYQLCRWARSSSVLRPHGPARRFWPRCSPSPGAPCRRQRRRVHRSDCPTCLSAHKSPDDRIEVCRRPATAAVSPPARPGRCCWRRMPLAARSRSHAARPASSTSGTARGLVADVGGMHRCSRRTVVVAASPSRCSDPTTRRPKVMSCQSFPRGGCSGTPCRHLPGLAGAPGGNASRPPRSVPSGAANRPARRAAGGIRQGRQRRPMPPITPVLRPHRRPLPRPQRG